jgi:hypothetical protein
MIRRRMRLERHVAYIGKKRRVSVGNPVGKILLGRPRRGWKYDIKMYIREI